MHALGGLCLLGGLVGAASGERDPRLELDLGSRGPDECPECGWHDGLALWDSLLQTSVSVSHRAPLHGARHVQILNNTGDIGYVGKLTVAKQTLWGIMDTGSFDLVGFRKGNCKGCGPKASVLACSAPSCTVGGGSNKCLAYGSGTTCGDKATADVSVGPLTSTGQSFLLGHSASMPVMSAAGFQAIVGLGVPEQGELLPGLGARYFSVCLPSGGSGRIVWNDDAPGKGFTHLQVLASRFWGLEMTDAQLRNAHGSRKVGCSPRCGAILDTGTSLIGVPTSTFRRMSRGVGELGESCDKIHTLPSLHFKLGGKDFVLPPTAFVGFYTQKAIPWLPDWAPQPVLQRCQLLMVDMGEQETQLGSAWILGMPFFRHYYTTFDLGSPSGTDVKHMMVHTAPTGDSCKPGDDSRYGQPRLMTVDPHKLHMPRWAAGTAVRPGADNSTAPLF